MKWPLCSMLLVGLALSGAGRTAAAEAILHASGDQSYPPYEYLDDDGRPTGFNVELMRAVAEVMGLQIEIELQPWNEARAGLQSGRIDILTGMFYSPQRDMNVDFTVPHSIVSHAVFVPEDVQIQGLQDIRGLAIIVQEDDIMHDFVRDRQLTKQIVAVPSQLEALRALASGRAEVGLLGRLQGLYWVSEYGLTNIKTVGAPFEPRRYCFAVVEGNDVLLAQLNEGLNILKATGQYDTIYENWFGVYGQGPATGHILPYLALIAGPLLLLLGASLLWLRSLKRTVHQRTQELQRELQDRQRAEESARDSEEMARAVLNAAMESMLLLDTEGNVLDVNEAATKRLLRSRANLVGKNLYALLPPDLAASRRAKIEEVIRTRRSVRFIDERSGTIFQSAVYPVYDHQGRVTRVAIYAEDITERRRIEEERARLEAQVLHAQKLESLGVLAGGIAHDFNNLLMGILGNAELALSDLSGNSQALESLQEIRSAANRAADLCRQMLAYSGKGRFVIQSTDLSDLINEMSPLLAVSVTKKAEVRYETAPDLPAVECDATQIRQILMNLVANASDALGDETGVVTVRTGATYCSESDLKGAFPSGTLPAGRYVTLEVEDTGCGMEPEMIEKIFDPFYSTKFTGRGLGLAAVLGIVRGHQGALLVNSEPERGSLFRVVLPEAEQPDEIEAGGRRLAAHAAGRRTVLVIDDEDAVRALAARMLEKLGYAVRTAGDGREGIEILKKHAAEISVVLLDMSMPRMSGPETLREIHRLKKDVHVIFSSGYDEQDIAKRFTSEGLATFIQKPYQMATLREKIREVLD